MSVKDLVDGIRRDVKIPLSLCRARDLISRLVYDTPYASAMAAEAAGSLPVASLDGHRLEDLSFEYGQIAWDVSVAAAPRVNALTAKLESLRPETISEIATLAAQRDAWYDCQNGKHTDLKIPDGRTPTDMFEDAKFQMRSYIAQLPPRELSELMTLYKLGRGDDGHDFAEQRRRSDSVFPEEDARYLSQKARVHFDVIRGLSRLGPVGDTIFNEQPELRVWLKPEQSRW
jgi:hypothetical protein